MIDDPTREWKKLDRKIKKTINAIDGLKRTIDSKNFFVVLFKDGLVHGKFSLCRAMIGDLIMILSRSDWASYSPTMEEAYPEIERSMSLIIELYDSHRNGASSMLQTRIKPILEEWRRVLGVCVKEFLAARERVLEKEQKI